MVSPKRFESCHVTARVSYTARGVLCIHSDGGSWFCCARFARCRDVVSVRTYWYAIVHFARDGTLDGVHSGKELAVDKCVATKELRSRRTAVKANHMFADGNLIG